MPSVPSVGAKSPSASTTPLPRSARLRGFSALGPSLDQTSGYDTLNSCTPVHCSQIADATNSRFGSIGPPTEIFIPPPVNGRSSCTTPVTPSLPPQIGHPFTCFLRCDRSLFLSSGANCMTVPHRLKDEPLGLHRHNADEVPRWLGVRQALESRPRVALSSCPTTTTVMQPCAATVHASASQMTPA